LQTQYRYSIFLLFHPCTAPPLFKSHPHLSDAPILHQTLIPTSQGLGLRHLMLALLR
jgi:hypothetical protein